ncbi:probable ubiquitin thioesterase DG1039 [Cotesia glomerata]|uniref:Uncharacterized protein n=1 Tax=Cotesia glomerata TaxID=32391 RepID=A0AAV7HVW8_COTGL|nr:probable ubiquitin thioesterase DG1039 [Cotesia glomerata]KAH0549334.1 hypothetical protein KQX54_008353 [Cotesia glomerata]
MEEKSLEECLNDPQFIQVLSTTLSLEVVNKEKEIKETNRQIESLKSVISSFVKDRKRLKQLTQIEQKNKIIFQTTLDSLRKIENEKILKLCLVKEKQNDSLLKAQIDQERFLKILETYKETWIKYEAEYEKFPLAIERKKNKNEVEKMKIQCMIQEYKRVEYQKMLNLRSDIDDLKIQSVVIKLSETVLDRWNQQNKINRLIDEYYKLEIKWNEIFQQHQKMMAEFEAETREKALARQQMPPPRIDFSFMRAVYAETSPKDPFCYTQRLRKRSDSDSISVNTLRLEEICCDEPSVPVVPIQNTYEEENDPIPTETYEEDVNIDTVEEQEINETNDPNAETLEKVCRQLSITEELEVSNYEKIPSQTEAQIHFESHPIQKTFSNEKINHLKKKISYTDDSFDSSLKPIEKKKPKIDHRLEVSQQDYQKQKLFQTKQQSHNDIHLPISHPQVRSIETISQPLNTNVRPPMAEVPPTPSVLYSPRLGSNYGSSTNLSNIMNQNLDDSDINWKDFVPSRAGSDISYVSGISMFDSKKTVGDSKAIKPISQPQDLNVNNFLNFFPSTNNQTNKRFF